MVIVLDYYGLLIGFEDEAQMPIQIIGERNGKRSEVELLFKAGLLQEIYLKKKGLDSEDQALLLKIIDANSSELIKAWLNHFLYQVPVCTELLTKKI